MGTGTDETGQTRAGAENSGLTDRLKHPGSTYLEGVCTRIVSIEPKTVQEAKLTSKVEKLFLKHRTFLSNHRNPTFWDWLYLATSV
jgi:hypothetical protein